ncbi:MAG: hypothetical protein KGJ33_02365, partial [Patescibacteria group bacterium]|nr:hypothetical protein [Patescibacteria group bacterium]
IDASLAKKIAEDINSGILMALKSNTQVPPTTTIQGNMVEKHISAVESAGGFSVIREAPPAPGSLPGVQTGVFSEPLADHLLARPHAEELQSAELAEDHPLPRVTSKQAPEMRPTEPDPYRESVE